MIRIVTWNFVLQFANLGAKQCKCIFYSFFLDCQQSVRTLVCKSVWQLNSKPMQMHLARSVFCAHGLSLWLMTTWRKCKQILKGRILNMISNFDFLSLWCSTVFSWLRIWWVVHANSEWFLAYFQTRELEVCGDNVRLVQSSLWPKKFSPPPSSSLPQYHYNHHPCRP